VQKEANTSRWESRTSRIRNDAIRLVGESTRFRPMSQLQDPCHETDPCSHEWVAAWGQ
jgi:hypothetical protein